jgi:hypothetical protein
MRRRGTSKDVSASSSADADSGTSDKVDSDEDDRRDRHRTHPRRHGLSREQWIREVDRIERRGTHTPKRDYMSLFAKRAREAKTKFRGTPPAKFALGTEPFATFRERFMSYAITSGWDDTQQVVAMLRFLEGRAATIFNEWINQGYFVKMDADVMWRKLERRFCDPSEERQAARMDLSLRLQRSGESIQAYEQVFMELAKRAELTEEEMVTQWVKNIEPHLAEKCRTHTALRDLSFQEVVTVARRAVRQSTEVQQPQVALKRTIHAVSARPNDWSGEVDGATPTEERTFLIQAITESVRKQLVQELTPKQQHLEDTVGQLKRELDSRQVMQVQQEVRDNGHNPPPRSDSRGPPPGADRRGPPPNRGRGRGAGNRERPTRTQSYDDRVRLPPDICSKCGSREHLRCAWKEVCTYCQQMGHKEVVCFKRIRDQGARIEPK